MTAAHRPVAARQGDLFADADSRERLAAAGGTQPPPLLLRHQLLNWQERLAAHQGPLFCGGSGGGAQIGLFGIDPSADPQARAASLAPLSLQPQSLSFWRWPEPPQQGAAIYLVTDRPAAGNSALLLYIGETGRADRRWKGDHDCKRYLAAYGEALQRCDLVPALSIRFWSDVPVAIRPRRALEQALIRRWLPPFNKETRERWATPFTADPDGC
ncbi:MAG: GIY-YIG nuclease family protein [Synechococcus sp.]|nr:GIY-YIG nuclease family protein [Synechococcus sp.]